MNFWTFLDRNAWGVLAALGLLVFFGTTVAVAAFEHAKTPCVCPAGGSKP